MLLSCTHIIVYDSVTIVVLKITTAKKKIANDLESRGHC